MRTQDILLQEQINTVTPQVIESKFAELTPDWKLNLHSTPYSRLYYFTQGEAWIEYNGVITPMKAGHFYLVPAGLPFRAGCDTWASKIYFHMTLLKRDGYDLAMELSQVVGFPVNRERLDLLNKLCCGHGIRNALMLKNLLMDDMLEAFSMHGVGEDTASYSASVQRILKYIRKHLSVQISVQELADQLFISKRTLNNAFHRELGKTVGQYIDEMVLIEAQRQLLLTNRSIREISDNLGFSDQFYFSRRFKMFCGKTPTAYRKEGKI